jgi:RNA polymerase sigma-70 factor, ECF subfamily
MSALASARTVDFDGLYRHHAPSVYRYAYAVLGNHADAEDVTQQTFLNAYRACAKGTKPRKAQNWLLRIAHNEVRRHFRSRQRKALEVELDDRVAQPPAERIDPSLAEVVGALRRLPPTQRSALVMREFEGRSFAEAAEMMEMSQSALQALTFRARRALAKGLSVLPIPTSLFLFRAQAASAAGAGPTAMTAGGSAAVGGGTAAASGSAAIAAGVGAKVVAAAATVAVAGGVGYGVSAGPDARNVDRKAGQAPAVAAPRDERPATDMPSVAAVGAQPGRAWPAAPGSPRRNHAEPKLRPKQPVANADKISTPHTAGTGPGGTREQASQSHKPHPVTPASTKLKPASPSRPSPRPRPAGHKIVTKAKTVPPKHTRPNPGAQKLNPSHGPKSKPAPGNAGADPPHKGPGSNGPARDSLAPGQPDRPHYAAGTAGGISSGVGDAPGSSSPWSRRNGG